jgi:hypothetical protein
MAELAFIVVAGPLGAVAVLAGAHPKIERLWRRILLG